MQLETRRRYTRLREAAETLARRQVDAPELERGLTALERGRARAVERDHFASAGRAAAESAISSARKRRER